MKKQSIHQSNWTIGKAVFRLLLLVSCCYAGLAATDRAASVAQEASGQKVINYPLVSRGFVFVNGTYLTPPYKFELRGNELWINGQRLVADDLVLESFLDLEFPSDEIDAVSRTVSVDPTQHIPPTPLEMLADAAHATAHGCFRAPSSRSRPWNCPVYCCFHLTVPVS